MKVYYLPEVVQFLERASEKDRARVTRVREYFQNYGFIIGPKYIKKIKSDLWELRAGKVRIFICFKQGKAIGVHAIYKKSQKLPLKDLSLVIKRCKEL